MSFPVLPDVVALLTVPSRARSPSQSLAVSSLQQLLSPLVIRPRTRLEISLAARRVPRGVIAMVTDRDLLPVNAVGDVIVLGDVSDLPSNAPRTNTETRVGVLLPFQVLNASRMEPPMAT